MAPGAYSETFASTSLSSNMVSNTSPSVSPKDTAACRQTLLDIFYVSPTCIKHLFDKQKKKVIFELPEMSCLVSVTDSSQPYLARWKMESDIYPHESVTCVNPST